MKPILLAIFCGLLAFTPPAARARLTSDLPLIEDLDRVIQLRLSDPEPGRFGMSRMVLPYSMGEHFAPVTRNNQGRDFVPENDTEQKVIAALEARKLQVGLYLFGEAILLDEASSLNYRALKGPGAITANTPRPRWYPSQQTLPHGKDVADSLADWAKIYPVAQRAMKSFKDGGKGFELQLGGWTIAARPAIASHEGCVTCHNNRAIRRQTTLVKRGEAIGGVLYAFRVAPPNSLLSKTTVRTP